MYAGIECSAENEELTEAGKYQIPGKGSWSCVKRYWYNSQYQGSSWLEEIGKMRWNSSNLRRKRFAIFRTFLATLVMLQWILWTELLLCAAHGLAALANLVRSKIKITFHFTFTKNWFCQEWNREKRFFCCQFLCATFTSDKRSRVDNIYREEVLEKRPCQSGHSRGYSSYGRLQQEKCWPVKARWIHAMGCIQSWKTDRVNSVLCIYQFYNFIF